MRSPLHYMYHGACTKANISKLMELKASAEANPLNPLSQKPKSEWCHDMLWPNLFTWGIRAALTLREYPKGLGKSLVNIYKSLEMHKTPMACLRQKADLPLTSELHLFNNLPIGDTWPDAGLKECYLYLWAYKKVTIPDEWASTMIQFTKDLRAAPGLQVASMFLSSAWLWLRQFVVK